MSGPLVVAVIIGGAVFAPLLLLTVIDRLRGRSAEPVAMGEVDPGRTTGRPGLG